MITTLTTFKVALDLLVSAENIRKILTKPLQQIAVEHRVGFQGYIQQQVERYSVVKTIISGDTPLRLDQVYVNLCLKKKKEEIRDDQITAICDRQKRFVFTATAGSGKSMLMRYLYFQFLNEGTDRLPIFVELRDLNQYPDQTIVDFVTDKIAHHIKGFTSDQANFALRKGMVALFLDGFDEIDFDQRDIRAKEINELAGSFENLIIMVSSRPDDVFNGWTQFHVYRLVDFTEGQIRDLIERLPYDQDAKEFFLRKLNEGLYQEHHAFLVNPLLTIMMLLTLQMFAEVPAKVYLFYEHTFEVLFSKHDAIKGGGFKRKRHVSLPLDDYRRLFACFCTVSYLQGSFSFSRTAATLFLDEAIRASQILVNKDDMLDDLEGCTCMLTQDGVNITFSHRSFQEYFVACFISNVKTAQYTRLITRVAKRTRDNVIPMLAAMDSERFEEEWALPQIARCINAVKDLSCGSNPVEYSGVFFGRPTIRILNGADSSYSFSWPSTVSSDNEVLLIKDILMKIYDGSRFVRHHVEKYGEENNAWIDQIRNGKLNAKDHRFQMIRDNMDYQKQVEIALTPRDNWWVRKTKLGGMVVAFDQWIRSIHSQIQERVNARADGIKSILDI